MHAPFGPILVQFGPLTIRWYGVIMATAILVGTLIASRYVERFGFPGDTIFDLLKWCFIPALVGARLYFVFIQTPRTPDGIGRYLANPLEILAVWHGGIHIFGGLIFGSVALILYVWSRRLPLAIYLDAAGVALLLSQAIGRLGNFINQELYGPPTTLPWGLRIDPEARIAPYDDLTKYPESVRFQPLFLYELTWNLIGFTLLYTISRRLAGRLRNGDLILLYLIWYPLGRFIIEFMRSDSWFFSVFGVHFNLVHIISALVILGSATVLYARHRPAPARPDLLSTLGAAITERYERARAAVQRRLPAPEGVDVPVITPVAVHAGPVAHFAVSAPSRRGPLALPTGVEATLARPVVRHRQTRSARGDAPSERDNSDALR